MLGLNVRTVANKFTPNLGKTYTMKKPIKRKTKANPYHTARKAARARVEASKFHDGLGKYRAAMARRQAEINATS